MKIIDRYITAAVVASFAFGVTMFMVLLMAMTLLDDLIELITEQGVPVGTALAIFGYQIPSTLSYAFPMSILLGILLSFSRMSAESEMVAIRAGGVSFVRIVAPTLVVALAVTGLTFWIADVFVPFAGARANALTEQALQHMRQQEPLSYPHEENGELLYTVSAADLNVAERSMRDVKLVFNQQGHAVLFIEADRATWQADDANPNRGRWTLYNARMVPLQDHAPQIRMEPGAAGSVLVLDADQLKENPFDFNTKKTRPQNFTAREIRQKIRHMEEDLKKDPKEVGKWRMGLALRYAVPFASLVFALIGAPLGLRHHRTSSAVGLGVSLIVIFVYYFISTYMNTLGENNAIPPVLAAWLPNIFGAGLGVGLIIRANR